MKQIHTVLLGLLCVFFVVNSVVLAGNDPLPSWNEGASKRSIITFVEAVTDESGPDYVQPGERVAVFDNDGTLWSEKPVYFEFYFTIDRVKEMAADHPEWKTTQPFQAVLEGEMNILETYGKEGFSELIMATHTGMTIDEFTDIVTEWLQTAQHPTLHKPYTALVYKPMLELLDYLRSNGFKNYIVSGGGIEFMRSWAEDVYGIPPEQVVGSSLVTTYELRSGEPVLVRQPKVHFDNAKANKVVGIHQCIGRRPIFAFGNSDGDMQMLQWSSMTGKGKRFAGIVHHTDAKREFAYDHDSHVGHLDGALMEAKANGWTVVDMKKEWRVVYP